MNRRKFITGAGALVASAVAPTLPIPVPKIGVIGDWRTYTDAEILAHVQQIVAAMCQIPSYMLDPCVYPMRSTMIINGGVEQPGSSRS